MKKILIAWSFIRYRMWYWFNKLWFKIFTPKPIVKDRIGGMECEIEYVGFWGSIVGYWAYGYYDDSLPFCPSRRETCSPR